MNKKRVAFTLPYKGDRLPTLYGFWTNIYEARYNARLTTLHLVYLFIRTDD